MSDPEHLWSPYGIRSLSLSHPEFGKGEDYWKGAIWMPMNYMALTALHGVCNSSPTFLTSSHVSEQKYAAVEGPYQEQARRIYTELRRNIIDSVFKEYERTGYVWEQYDALTGEGRRSHPFTGWTSLVTLSKHKLTFPRGYSAELLLSHFRKVLIRISVLCTDEHCSQTNTQGPMACVLLRDGKI